MASATTIMRNPILIIVKAETVKFLSPGTLPKITGTRTVAAKKMRDCHSGGGNIFQANPIMAGMKSTARATYPDMRISSTPSIRLRLNQM